MDLVMLRLSAQPLSMILLSFVISSCGKAAFQFKASRAQDATERPSEGQSIPRQLPPILSQEERDTVEPQETKVTIIIEESPVKISKPPMHLDEPDVEAEIVPYPPHPFQKPDDDHEDDELPLGSLCHDIQKNLFTACEQSPLFFGPQLVFENLNLSRTWLSQTNLSRSILRLSNLQESCGQGIQLSGGLLANNNFYRSDYRGANFSRASIAKSNFSSSLLSQANFSDSQVEEADFSGSCLNQSNFSAAQLKGQINFSGSDLSGTTFAGASFSLGIDFSAARLQGANFQGATWQPSSKATSFNINFADADLRGANFLRSDVTGLNFSGAQLEGATWTDGRICSEQSVGVCR
ncbi:pentapeptide repeat-containing protein [Pseudobacteriovorax antillogorgiicola]|uniref:Uncharacterized protein YjbI, contains pentapeptide repeats n=1 Tax=Pseudobacteriovorax antillogorgiicola TaxID=1513793 RepID=A0A1Y6CMB2_9BACT|nr:pentapeptide repeat-containing protein [Pseudobacteriovorax antillogorgiicola]TCS44801.1 uncharacterized protein YjbI with pentapeptide repeats [Pseudobacteriovorax antillogorgiicola]SMF77351.1 Uncharacterized protein YjbI, contains pentapeptide repeats [Pseudobacteriovorax antillogorgiicola]